MDLFDSNNAIFTSLTAAAFVLYLGFSVPAQNIPVKKAVTIKISDDIFLDKIVQFYSKQLSETEFKDIKWAYGIVSKSDDSRKLYANSIEYALKGDLNASLAYACEARKHNELSKFEVKLKELHQDSYRQKPRLTDKEKELLSAQIVGFRLFYKMVETDHEKRKQSDFYADTNEIILKNSR